MATSARSAAGRSTRRAIEDEVLTVKRCARARPRRPGGEAAARAEAPPARRGPGGAGREPRARSLVAYRGESRALAPGPLCYALVHVFRGRPWISPSGERARWGDGGAAGRRVPHARKMNASRDDIARPSGARRGCGRGAAAWHRERADRPSFGWHRVRLVAREARRAGAIRPRCRRTCSSTTLLQRREEVGTHLRTTTASYEIRVGDDVVRDFTPTRRVAARTQASAED